MGGACDPELPWEEEALAWETGKAAQMGTSQQPGHRGRASGRGWSYICRPTPVQPLITEALLLWWCPGLFLQTFLVVELFTLIPQAIFFTANSCPLSGSALQTPLQHQPSLGQQARDTQLKLGLQLCSVGHAHSSYFALPSTDYLLHSPLIPWRSLSVPTDFPTVRIFLSVEKLFSPSASPLGLLILFDSPFLSLSYLVVRVVFLFFFLGVQSLPLMFSRCSVRTVSFVDVFLMYLWGEINSMSYYSSTLTSSNIFYVQDHIICE